MEFSFVAILKGTAPTLSLAERKSWAVALGYFASSEAPELRSAISEDVTVYVRDQIVSHSYP